MDPSAQPSEIVPGSILAGKYRVARLLGKGGMGMVVEAQHVELQDKVALKFLLPEFANRPEFAERFLREARSAVKIKSEHVARVIDVGKMENGTPFMVMEYLDGGDLADRLQKTGQFALHDAVDFVIQGCEAIAEAHAAGIIHRDIKPANLFLVRDSDGSPLVKVLDFGISKQLGTDTDGLTRTTATMGSALYMSPEQMRNAKGVDFRADIYSLGVTLYELLVGEQPFSASTLPELCALVLTGAPTPLRQARPDLPEDFARTLEKAYAREREHRYQTVAELVFALAPYAPPRSQSTIDRMGRMVNAAAPRAGGATQLGPQQLQIGAYGSNVPHSARATETFAHNRHMAGASTNANLATTNSPKVSRAPLFVGLGMVAMVSVVAVVGLFYAGVIGKPATTDEPTVRAATTTEPDEDERPEPAKSSVASEPALPPNPAGSASVAPPEPTVPPSASVAVRPPPTPTPKLQPKQTPTPKSTGATPKNPPTANPGGNVFDNR